LKNNSYSGQNILREKTIFLKNLKKIYMRHYSVYNQNYYIFKTNSVEKNPYVHFQWGKFDFRMTFFSGDKDLIEKNPKIAFSAANGEQFIAKTLEVFYQNEWFEFVKPTSHGLQLEETLWIFDSIKYYVEFPKNLRNIAQSICAKELGMTPIK
tara:strand:- start:1962 stop:2420 length:459 start_codon:yes stop_codon:yes gene_type:complete